MDMESDATVNRQAIETYVAGIMYKNHHVIVPHLALREQVYLYREPDNDYDPNAVRIEKQNKGRFGYIPKKLAEYVAPYMDATREDIVATVTEIISNTQGTKFKVKISFQLPETCVVPPATFLFQDIEFHYEEDYLGNYVMVNSSEPTFDEIKSKFEADGMFFIASGLCYRPAINGHQYPFYVRFDRTSGVTEEKVDLFFSQRFGIMSDAERARQIEITIKQYESELSDLNNKLKKANEAAQTYKGLAKEYDGDAKRNEQEILVLKDEIKQHEKNLKNIEDEKRKLKYKHESTVSSLGNIPSLRADDISDTVAQALRNVASDHLPLSDSLKIISTIFPDRIEILKTAWKSAEELRDFRDRRRAFELLWKLATEYWTMCARGRGMDARSVFDEAYSRESETVENNKRARRLRTFSYDGKQIEMMKHLKIGTTLRIHFEWDAENRKIIVGHCGVHLPGK